MTLHWTKDARAELLPLPADTAPPDLSYDVESLRSAIVAVLDGEKPKLRVGMKRKLGDVDLAAEVLASYKDFDTKMDARIQGALVTILRGWGDENANTARDLVRHWITRGGLPFAVRAQYEHSIRRVMHPKANSALGFDFEVTFVEAEPTGGWSMFGLKPQEVRPILANAILVARPDVYAEVVATIAELRKKTKNPMLRCDLSALVPTERAWALEDVRAALHTKKTPLDLAVVAFLFPVLGRCDETRTLFDRLLENAFIARRHVYDAVRVLEADAIAPLVQALHAFEKEPPRQNMGLAEARHLARALALFDDERVVKAFLPWIGETKSFGPIAAEYMQRFPAQATRAVAPRLLEKTKGAEPAQHLLERIARTHPNEVRDAASSLSKDQRAAVEKLLGARAEPASVAASSDLPEVLRDPPWRRKGTRPSLPIVTGFAEQTYEERVVWDDEAQRTAAATASLNYDRRPKELAPFQKKIADVVRLGEGNTQTWARPHVAWHAIRDDAVLDLWNDTPIWARSTSESSSFSEVEHMLARFGPRAIPGAIASTAHTMYEMPFAALMRCDSPRVARLAMRGLGRGLLRRSAAGYFAAFPEAAAIGLLPIALGPASRDKVDAASALRQHVDHARLRAVAKTFGDEAVRGLAEMLAFDPVFDCPKGPPKLSAFADPAALPALRSKSGGELSEEAKRNFLEMLQFTPFDPPYVGIETAKNALEPASLDELLRALLDAWIAAGAATASAWALRAIGHVGSDAMARELAAKIRKWPREKARPRALVGVDVLACMGTDVALMHLFDLSKTAKNKHVEQRAKVALDAAAAARGLSGDALEDRLVPSLDLDPDGTTTLDYGARRFTVRVDEQLAPHVFDGTTRLPSLPRATKTDDAAKAKEASARYKTLTSDLATLAKTQLWRFEHAMIKGRRWDALEHRALLVDHPLAGRISRKLVWAVFDGDAPRATFRVAEDGTLADDRDAPLELATDARIGIPHTLTLDAETKLRWTTILADYAVIQPFEQVARPTFSVAASEKKKKSLDHFAKREIPYGVVFGRLESRGWRRGPMEEGSTSTLEKDFGAVSATLSFSPSLFVREKPPAKITIDDVSFGGATLGDLPAIAFSEAMFDLSVFAAK